MPDSRCHACLELEMSPCWASSRWRQVSCRALKGSESPCRVRKSLRIAHFSPFFWPHWPFSHLLLAVCHPFHTASGPELAWKGNEIEAVAQHPHLRRADHGPVQVPRRCAGARRKHLRHPGARAAGAAHRPGGPGGELHRAQAWVRSLSPLYINLWYVIEYSTIVQYNTI